MNKGEKRGLEAQDDESSESGQKRIKLADAARCCVKCEESKPLDQYNVMIANKDGLQPYCKQCSRLASKMYNKTHSGFINSLISRSIINTTERNKKGRNHETSMLTKEKLNKLIKKQDGKCAISGAVLVFKPFSNNQASVDRINNDLGYVDGNYRIVCLEFNSATKWSRELLVKAVSLSGIPPENFETEISDLEIAPRRGGRHTTVQRKWVRESKNGITVIFCHYCSETKPDGDFYKQLSLGCKTCNIKRVQEIHSTWRGAIQALLCDARKHTEARNNTRLKMGATEQKCTLTYGQLVVILKKQGGMCAYSQVALSPKMGVWKMSLERIDITKGYDDTNACLVCQPFNGSDHSGRADGTVDGSGGWTREKFLQYAALVSA